MKPDLPNRTSQNIAVDYRFYSAGVSTIKYKPSKPTNNQENTNQFIPSYGRLITNKNYTLILRGVRELDDLCRLWIRRLFE
jgi:hypothetical protein